jgi:hypothetical protein
MKPTLTLLTGLLLLAGGTNAKSASILQWDSYADGASAFGPPDSSPYESHRIFLSFDLFDPSMGTLDEVIITLNSGQYTVFGDIVIGEIDPMGPGFMGSAIITSKLLAFIFPTSDFFAAGGEATPVAFGAPGDGFASGSDPGFFSDFEDFVTYSGGPPATDPFLGLGRFDIGFDNEVSVISGFLDNAFYVDSTATSHWSGDVTVEYLYTPIPEPSGALLAFLGLGALGLEAATMKSGAVKISKLRLSCRMISPIS